MERGLKAEHSGTISCKHATVIFYNIYFLKIREPFTNHDGIQYTIHTLKHM